MITILYHVHVIKYRNTITWFQIMEYLRYEYQSCGSHSEALLGTSRPEIIFDFRTRDLLSQRIQRSEAVEQKKLSRNGEPLRDT